MNKCSIDGCDKSVHCKGMCRGHFYYDRLYGGGPSWYFSTEPLRRLLRLERVAQAESWVELSERLGLKQGIIYNLLRNPTVGWEIADEVCIALHLHPVLVYPEWINTLDLDSYLERRKYARRVAGAVAS